MLCIASGIFVLLNFYRMWNTNRTIAMFKLLRIEHKRRVDVELHLLMRFLQKLIQLLDTILSPYLNELQH
jgi:hypothetical protein